MNAELFLSKGVAAANAGDKATATQWLAQAVRADPKLVEGWWWLANLLEDAGQQRYCLQRVHALDPNFDPTGPTTRQPAQPTPGKLTSPVPAGGEAGGQSHSTLSAKPTREWPPSTTHHSTAAERPASVAPSPTDLARGSQPRRSGIPVATLTLGGIIFIGILFVGVVILALLPPSPSAAPVAGGTLPPTWTPTPGPTPLPSATPFATMPPSTPDPLQGNEQAASALVLMREGRYREAVAVWDQVIGQDPTNHAAYYWRAVSNLEALTGEVILQVYRSRVLQAIEDLDLAIASSDGFNGDYFGARARAFEDLAGVADARVDRERLSAVALENTERAEQLPGTDPFAARHAPLDLAELGRCEEGMELARRLKDERGGDSVAPSVGLELILGNLSLCLGDFPAAIESFRLAIDRDPQCRFYYLRAESFYLRGDPANAKLELNHIINLCPSFAGYRYYLRALIREEEGNAKGASDDLLLGSINTWDQGGLLPYVQSLIAFGQGDRTAGVELLKQAEMTMDGGHRPFVERFQRELADLGEEPYHPTPDPYPEATPLAPLPEAHPTRAPVRTIVLTDGAGPLELAPGAVLDLYFVPPMSFDFREIMSLELHLISDNGGVPALDVQFYRSRDRRWEAVEVTWGENRLEDPDPLVNTSGDVYLRLRSLGPEAVVLREVGLQMTVQTPGGGYVRYSYLDE
jgi:tetratricopeptide (TPR) repeat protein